MAKVKGHAERRCTHLRSRHINRVCDERTAPECHGHLEASKPASSNSLAHIFTAHGRLDMATHQIRVNFKLIKTFALALMWAITLLFMATTHIMLPGPS